MPSDPNALIKMLSLRVASFKAGNTGVRNEIVSLSDELLRQGILDKPSNSRLEALPPRNICRPELCSSVVLHMFSSQPTSENVGQSQREGSTRRQGMVVVGQSS